MIEAISINVSTPEGKRLTLPYLTEQTWGASVDGVTL
jgi:hypothetical protein